MSVPSPDYMLQDTAYGSEKTVAGVVTERRVRAACGRTDVFEGQFYGPTLGVAFDVLAGNGIGDSVSGTVSSGVIRLLENLDTVCLNIKVVGSDGSWDGFYRINGEAVAITLAEDTYQQFTIDQLPANSLVEIYSSSDGADSIFVEFS